jgi:mRNA interferase YafQ
MREINTTTRYRKDYRRIFGQYRNAKAENRLRLIIKMLISDVQLPRQLRDHELSGELLGLRELHVLPDLLLMYYKEGQKVLNLVRIGSHSDLFNG